MKLLVELLGLEPRHHKWFVLGVVVLTCVIVLPLLYYESSLRDKAVEPPRNRTRRDTPGSGTSDSCIAKYGGVELTYIIGQSTGFQFDLCSVINCKGKDPNWRGYDVYLCGFSWGGPTHNPWCGRWRDVMTYSGLWDPPPYRVGGQDIGKKIKIQRQQLQPLPGSHKQNPILLSVYNLTTNPWSNSIRHRTKCGDRTNTTMYLVLGVDHSGTDTMGLIKLTLLNPPPTNTTVSPSNGTKAPEPQQNTGVINIDYSKLTRSDVVRLATGYGDKNLWLDWVTATAESMNMSNCVVCSSARPTLFTTPAPLYPDTDPIGFNCMINMTMYPDPANCTTLSSLFPHIKNHTIPPTFSPRIANYTCFHRNLSTGVVTDMGQMQADWCQRTLNVSTWQNASSMVQARGDLFWYCGDKTLHLSLPSSWVGTCALVRLAVPLILLGMRDTQTNSGRQKRNAFDMSQGTTTYMDAIGVPRGVPDQYKLADQVAAGFENIPILAALFPITPNKNVDRINYVHYNVLRLANSTRDAVGGLSEQLAATSLMTVQNRIALDMLLAEKGGVCSMFQGLCCTFIPNNTAPDGSVTKALEGLRTLSEEMHEHSGIDKPLGGIFEKWFGKWKDLVVSVFLSLVGMLAVLALCGCCCIPCIRSLCERIIVTAVERKHPQPPPYQMTQMETATLLGEPPTDSDSDSASGEDKV